MASTFFLSRRSVEGATLTASSAQTTLPVTNLIGPTPSKVWRSTSLTTVYITVDFGAATAVDTLAMVGVNWTTSATRRLRGATSEANLTAAPGYDSTAVTAWPVTGKPTEAGWLQFTSLLRIGSTQTYRWWRIDIIDAGNAAGYLQAGALLLDVAVTPAISVSYGIDISDEPADIVVAGPYGRTFIDERDAPRLMTLPFDDLPESDLFGSFGALLRERKTSKPFLVCLDPSATTYLHTLMLYGVRKGARSSRFHEFQRGQTTIQMRELL